jgi:hypothetical protein
MRKPLKVKKSVKVYMVSFPENADYAEWWYMVGLFATRKTAIKFIKAHPIKRYEQRDGYMKPRTKYHKIEVVEIDKAPLLEEWNRREYFGRDKYITKREKLVYKRFLKKRRRKDALRKELRKIEERRLGKKAKL